MIIAGGVDGPARKAESARSAAPSATPPTSTRLLQRPRARAKVEKAAAPTASAPSTSTRSSRCPTECRVGPAASRAGHRPEANAGRQPLHADQRDRLGRLQAPAPDVGRPRRHHRHPRLAASTSRTPRCRRPRTGERKIVDWFTATDPVTEGRSSPAATPPGCHGARDGKPAHGRYRRTRPTRCPPAPTRSAARRGRTNVAGCEVCGDVNRDGDTTDRIGVLYDPGPTRSGSTATTTRTSPTRRACAPTTRATRSALRHGQPGAPPSSRRCRSPSTTARTWSLRAVRPGTGLPTVDFVDIGIVSGEHGSHVAGITAANNMFGGADGRPGPGAKLVSARACTFGPGCTAAALTDGMAELAANRGVDIINMSIGGLPALNDGDNAARRALQRDHRRAGVQLVISAGNSGNALNTIGDPSVAPTSSASAPRSPKRRGRPTTAPTSPSRTGC